jgi:hypothetical protein
LDHLASESGRGRKKIANLAGLTLVKKGVSRAVSTSLPDAVRGKSYVVQLALIACALSIGWFLYDGNVRVNLADEGYLWYGSYAMRKGQVPIRDFAAYDPGRYFWTAAWSYVLGEGVVSQRLACVFFQCLGVFAGLLAARRLSRNWAFLCFVALMFCAWMHPRYKVFEQSIALMFVYAAVLLLERPTLRRHFAVGIFGGLMAFFGKNHGAYHVAAFGLLITLAAWNAGWPAWFQRLAVWVGGMLLGYLPQWLMCLFVPRYFRSLMDNIGEIFKKGTNLATKVPWPWRVPEDYTSWWRFAAICEGLFYVALPLFLVLALVRAFMLGRRGLAIHPVFAAVACVTLPYTHYVFSRPDVVHLSHGAPLLCLGVIALAFTLPRWNTAWGAYLAAVLAFASLAANASQYGCVVRWVSPPGTLFPIDVSGERMTAQRLPAQILSSAYKLAHTLAKPNEPILFLPHMPGLYPFTGRLSPTRQTYFIFPATPEEDRALLAEIEAARVQWVLLHDYPLDGREDLRFSQAHPIVFDFFVKNFEAVPMNSLPPDSVIMHRIHRP